MEIKLNFQNSEKILQDIPKSLDELQRIFHQLFPEANKNDKYNFAIELKEEKIYISEDDFQEKFENLFDDEKIIHVEIQNIYNSDYEDRQNDNIEQNKPSYPLSEKENLDKSDKYNKDFINKFINLNNIENNPNLANSEFANKEKDNEENNNDNDNNNSKNNNSDSFEADVGILVQQYNNINEQLEKEKELNCILNKKL